MPAMLHGIVRDLLIAEPDFVLVGWSSADEDPLARAHEEHADMLITEDRAGNSTLDALLSAPPVRILAIAADGRNADALDVVRRTVNLDSGGKNAFADAVRSVAAGLTC